MRKGSARFFPAFNGILPKRQGTPRTSLLTIAYNVRNLIKTEYFDSDRYVENETKAVLLISLFYIIFTTAWKISVAFWSNFGFWAFLDFVNFSLLVVCLLSLFVEWKLFLQLHFSVQVASPQQVRFPI